MAEQAQEMVVDATPKKTAFMNKRSTHEDRIKKDEEELEKLKKQAQGETEEPVTEEKAEDKEEPKNAEEKTFKKRYGDLRRHSQEKEREFQKQLDELKAQLEKATKKEIKLPKTEEEIEEWAKEYPDVAGIVETIAIKKAKNNLRFFRKRIKEIDELNARTTKERAEVELLKYILTLQKLEKVMIFMSGQTNNLNGFKMHYMKIVKMLNQRQEPLTYTKQIETLAKKKRVKSNKSAAKAV